MIFNFLNDNGVELVELAPASYWPNPDRVDLSAIKQIRHQLSQFNVKPCSFQSLLFGRPELVLFAENQDKNPLVPYMKGLIDTASALGVHTLVFGSPKNRLKGNLTFSAAIDKAVPVFNALGDYAASKNCMISLEPNPANYGGDFIINTSEALILLENLNTPGVCLHFDTGGMFMNQEDIVNIIDHYIDKAAHFHISEPFLQSFEYPLINHKLVADALKANSYNKPVSIEMKKSPQNSIKTVRKAIAFASETYL